MTNRLIGPKSTIKWWWLQPRPMSGEQAIMTTEERLKCVEKALEEHCHTGQPPDSILYFMFDKADFPKHSDYDSRVMIQAAAMAKDKYCAEYKREKERINIMHSRADIYG